ncbi:hypothetical protein ACF1BU_01335 [Streptomyces sp. NPDC014724]
MPGLMVGGVGAVAPAALVALLIPGHRNAPVPEPEAAGERVPAAA